MMAGALPRALLSGFSDSKVSLVCVYSVSVSVFIFLFFIRQAATHEMVFVVVVV